MRISIPKSIADHCGPGNQSGHRTWDWDWRSKYFAPKLHCVHMYKLTHSNPPLPLFLSPPTPRWTEGKMLKEKPIGLDRSKKYDHLEGNTETSVYKDHYLA